MIDTPAVIRDAQPADVPAIAELCARAIHQAYAGLVTADYITRVVSHWYGPERLRREIAPAPGWFGFVVATEDGVAGVAGSGWAEGGQACELFTLYVDPARQRRGIGRALVAHEVDRARRSGGRWLDVAVLPGNLAAMRFYQACGFTPAGERPIYAPHGAEGGPDVAVIYRRAL